MRGSPFCARRGSSNTFYLGSSGRTGTFHTDTNLPPNFTWVTYSDYTGSGYDRGHLRPSADRTVLQTRFALPVEYRPVAP